MPVITPIRRPRVRGRSRFIPVSCAVIVAVFVLGGLWYRHTIRALETDPYAALPEVDPQDIIIETVVTVEAGSTFGQTMARAGVRDADATAIYEAAREFYDLASVRAGREFRLAHDVTGERLLGLVYQVDSERELRVTRDGEGGWLAALEDIVYETRLRTVEGAISSSLYAAGLAAGLDDAAIVSIVAPFEWTIDFSMDTRVGDTFRIKYEERYRDGEYVMPGAVIAGKYVNDGRAYYAFFHEHPDGSWGHYDEEGNSTRKLFLKAPVNFKYITSGFTTGRRYVEAFNVSTGHRAIDYAAATGTPIRAVGDGTVVAAGWNGPYGNFTSIRHNGTYTTNYAHQSRILVKRGQQVSQGQIIGLVGSTGFSTGPHLHYEMVKNGVKINPLAETFPSTEPVPADERDAFMAKVAELRPQLDAE